jgi:hypothetical protein
VSLLGLSVRSDIANTNSHWRLEAFGREWIWKFLVSGNDPQKRGLDAGSRLALQYASVEGEEFLSTVLAKLLDSDDLKVEAACSFGQDASTDCV